MTTTDQPTDTRPAAGAGHREPADRAEPGVSMPGFRQLGDERRRASGAVDTSVVGGVRTGRHRWPRGSSRAAIGEFHSPAGTVAPGCGKAVLLEPT
jgi:hypothetical protein